MPRVFMGSLPRLRIVYAAEAVSAVSGSLLTVGLPFYTHHRWGWNARDNLLLGAGQGVAYVLGALSAQRFAQRWGRRTSLVVLYALLVLVGAVIAWTATSGLPALLVVLVWIEMGLVAMTWPMLESLVAADRDPARLSQRLGAYNVDWAVSSALALAASGTVIQYARPGAFFIIIAAGHLASLALLASIRNGREQETLTESSGPPKLAAEPALVRQRRLALWLSRISLPATYVVVYSLAPIFPSLPALRALSPATATLLASVWLVARAAAFVITGRTTFWHKRPGLLLWASVVMLAGFLGSVVPATWGGVALGPVLWAMVTAQAALGLSLGMIYAGSLYFGMILSEGSTEHGGYHEALIGLGQVLGPGVGAAVLWARPGNLAASIGAVATIITTSVLLAGVARARAGLGSSIHHETMPTPLARSDTGCS